MVNLYKGVKKKFGNWSKYWECVKKCLENVCLNICKGVKKCLETGLNF